MSGIGDDGHGFLPQMSQMGLSGLGVSAGDPDWPTGADIYTASINGIHDASAPTSFADVTAAPPSAGSKRNGKRSCGRTGAAAPAPISAASSDKVEVIVCQGTATVIPKSRSTVERRYICNGHPIHRVTFWRHRKHGCPHVTGEGSEGYLDGMQEGIPVSAPTPRQKRSNKDKVEKLDFDDSSFLNSKIEPPSFASGMPLKMKSMAMGYPMVDAVVDLAPQHSAGYDLRTGFDITPGNVPAQLDASSLGPQVPAFQAAPSGPQYGIMRAPGQGMPPMPNGPQAHMMPPFSLLTDALNLYYAPYRPAELDEEEISSPIHTTYVNHSSPYNSDRSEASDFMEDNAANAASDAAMFKGYLERNE